MLRPEHLAIGRDNHALDSVPQLTYVVSTPVVSQQHLHGVARQLLGPEAKLSAHAADEAIGQLRDIGEPVTEGWYVQEVNVEAVVKVRPEMPRRDLGLQVAV